MLNDASHRTIWAGVDPGLGPLAGLALRGDQLAVVGRWGRVRVGVVSPNGVFDVVATVKLPFGGGRLQLSPSGRHLLAWSPLGDRAVLREIQSDAPLLDLEGTAGVERSVVAGFATSRGGELILTSTAGGRLDGYDVSDGKASLAAALDHVAFVFEHLVTVGGGDTVMAIGHYPYEGRDSLVTLAVGQLLADPTAVQREIAERQGISEYAYAVAVGPCGSEAVVMHRDPDGEELPDEDDELLDGRSDLYGFRGFYVRGLKDGHLQSRTPSDAPVETGAALFATAASIVIGRTDRVETVARTDQRDVVVLPASVHAFDPSSKRIAIAAADGITLVELER